MPRISLVDKYHINIDTRLEQQQDIQKYGLYLLLPSALGVDELTYPEALFYRNHRSETVFEVKAESLSDLLRALRVLAVELTRNSDKRALRALVSAVTWQLVTAIDRQLKLVVQNQLEESEFRVLLTQLVIIQDSFSKLLQLGSTSNMGSMLRYADEYLVHQLQQQLLSCLQQGGAGNCRMQLIHLLNRLGDYAADRGYTQPTESEYQNDRLLNRSALLKQYLSSSIKLNSSLKALGSVMEQVVFGAAAALSMAIATAIAFVTQKAFGNFTTAFFFSLVLSYILKDRFKELSRNYVVHYLTRKRDTYRYQVDDPVDGAHILTIRDRARYLEKKLLPEDLLSIANQSSRIRMHAIGSVLCYRRSFHGVSNSKLRSTDGCRDSVTLNFSKMLRNLVQPKESLFKLDGEKVKQMNGRRVHFIPLILETDVDGEKSYQCYQLVVSGKGIHRLEKVERNLI